MWLTCIRSSSGCQVQEQQGRVRQNGRGEGGQVRRLQRPPRRRPRRRGRRAEAGLLRAAAQRVERALPGQEPSKIVAAQQPGHDGAKTFVALAGKVHRPSAECASAFLCDPFHKHHHHIVLHPPVIVPPKHDHDHSLPPVHEPPVTVPDHKPAPVTVPDHKPPSTTTPVYAPPKPTPIYGPPTQQKNKH